MDRNFNTIIIAMDIVIAEEEALILHISKGIT